MIPARLIRSVPTETSDLVEHWWETACGMHPSWEHVTYRDPIDPGLFPQTAPLWSACGSGAQMAGLVRLEAVWNDGGVWIDSDLELLRPLDPLRDLSVFATWEDERTVPDFVFGAEAHHPVIGQLLHEAIRRVTAGGGAWVTGPGVFTDLLPRLPVLLLPPGSFAPIHYVGKDAADWSRLPERFPYALGVHHWHHSWATPS